MKQNIGILDRLIRAALGALLFYFAWWWPSWIIFFFGVFCFYEALVGWCIVYQFLGKNTCPVE
jgi:hypothetical protein